MRKFVLPPCYVDGCRHPANAIINDALLCRKHALMEFEHVIESRKAISRESGLGKPRRLSPLTTGPDLRP
jgi:hypothetical protein